MNINNFSTIGIKIDYTTKYNQRAKLDTGTFCNYNCKFCYYKNRLHEKPNIEKIFKRVDELVEYGIKELDLSGGEPSILPEFFEILDYCKSKDVQVSCLSNGYKFADLEFCKKAQEHGINEILFSLHGSNAKLHDEIVQHQGAFEKILQAIRNAQSLNMRVRINCTVTPENYKSLYNEYPNLINEINPFEVNFIEVNYFDDNHNYDEVNLKDLVDGIKNAIDKINCKLINVRYVPFCYMKGYEKYNTNYYQIIYDIYDWNIASYTLQNLKKSKYKEHKILRDSFDCARTNRLRGFYKLPECKECKYFFICDGMKNGVGKENPVFPEKGKKINDVNYFRKNIF